MTAFLSIGDDVLWSGCWGSLPPEKAKIVSIEKNIGLGLRHGQRQPVDTISIVDKKDAIFTLDNQCWAYGYQIDVYIGFIED